MNTDRRTPAQKLLDINKRLEELDQLTARESRNGHNQQLRRLDKTRHILNRLKTEQETRL